MGFPFSDPLALATFLLPPVAASSPSALLDELLKRLHPHLPLEVACGYLPRRGRWELVAARDGQGDSLLDGTPRALPRAPDATASLLSEMPPPPARYGAGPRHLLPFAHKGWALGLLELYPVQPLSPAQKEGLEALAASLIPTLQRMVEAAATVTPEPPAALFERLFHGLMTVSEATDVQSVLQHIADFVRAAGWRTVTVSLRESTRFAITHLASAGLNEEEHATLLERALDGRIWLERMGPVFERYHHGDWYYLPYHDAAVQQMDIQGLVGHGSPEGSTRWHPRDLLYLPLRARSGQPIGLLVVDEPEDGQPPTEATMRPIQLFARNAGLILENIALHAQAQQVLAATAVVQEISALVSASLRVEDIIRHLVDQLVRRFHYPHLAIFLREGERFVPVGLYGYPADAGDWITDRGTALAGLAEAAASQWVAEAQSNPHFLMTPLEGASEIVVPMRRGREVLGLIVVVSTPARPLTRNDRELLETLSEQLATALFNARLFQETHQHALQLETASEVSRRVTSILNIDQLLAEVVDLVRRNFGYYQVHVFLHDAATGDWLLREGAGPAIGPMKQAQYRRAHDEGIVGHVGATGMALLVPDVSQEPRFRTNPFLPATRAQLAVPLRLGAQVLGVLDVHSEHPHGLAESDRSLLELLANQIAVALNNAQLFSAAEVQLAEREALYRASYGITAAPDMAGVLEAILASLPVPGLVRAALILPEEAETSPTGTLQVAALWNSTDAPLPIARGTRLLTETLPSFHSLVSDEVWVVADATTDPRLDPTVRASVQDLGVAALALIPLRAGGRGVGWLLLMSERCGGLVPALLRPYQTLADQAALAVERVRLLSQTELRARRLAALNRLTSNVLASLDLQQTLDDSVRAMAELFGVHQSGLLLFDEAAQVGRLVAQYREDNFQHVDPILVPLAGNPLTDQLLATRAPVYIRDVAEDPRATTIRGQEHRLSYHAILVVPLLTPKRVIGSISLDVVEGSLRAFDPEEVELAQTMAAHLAAAIENARLYEEATQRAYAMETASQVGQLLTRVPGEAAMLREMVQLLADRFNLSFVGIYLRHEQHPNRMALFEGSGAVGRALQARRHTLWEGQGLPGLALQHGVPIVSNAVREDRRFLRNALLPTTQAEAALPLNLSGARLGVLDLHSPYRDAFDRERLGVLATLADQIVIALQTAQLFSTQREGLRQLQELDRLKSEFLANMSHELRTPLNSIMGFSKIIQRGIDGPVTPKQEQSLAAIYHSGEHLLNLINEILDLSKISAGRMELHRQPVIVAEVIGEVLQALGPLAAERGLRVEHQPSETELPTLSADRTRVRQILVNLVSNGIKFTEQGGVFVSARRVARAYPGEGNRTSVSDPDGPFLEVAVKDTGIGIRPEEQALIFEEFRQLSGPARRQTGGTGLGLAIARRFTELHGGALWVESHVGTGSTFRFTLPLETQNAERKTQNGMAPV